MSVDHGIAAVTRPAMIARGHGRGPHPELGFPGADVARSGRARKQWTRRPLPRRRARRPFRGSGDPPAGVTAGRPGGLVGPGPGRPGWPRWLRGSRRGAGGRDRGPARGNGEQAGRSRRRSAEPVVPVRRMLVDRDLAGFSLLLAFGLVIGSQATQIGFTVVIFGAQVFFVLAWTVASRPPSPWVVAIDRHAHRRRLLHRGERAGRGVAGAARLRDRRRLRCRRGRAARAARWSRRRDRVARRDHDRRRRRHRVRRVRRAVPPAAR